MSSSIYVAKRERLHVNQQWRSFSRHTIILSTFVASKEEPVDPNSFCFGTIWRLDDILTMANSTRSVWFSWTQFVEILIDQPYCNQSSVHSSFRCTHWFHIPFLLYCTLLELSWVELSGDITRSSAVVCVVRIIIGFSFLFGTKWEEKAGLDACSWLLNEESWV